MIQTIHQSLRGSSLARRIVLPVFSRVGRGDMTIRHHYTGDPLRLDRFKHRNYWSAGKERERATMDLLRKVLRPGDLAFDVGANIGYLSLYMARLVGETGRVCAFDPDPNNLVYLRQNLREASQAVVVAAGVGSAKGEMDLYTEDLTGQNSSFLKDFSALRENAATAGVRPRVKAVVVEIITLDGFLRATRARPRCVKIDVEGFELEVLRGATGLLRECRPVLVVEVHDDPQNQARTFAFLEQAGYRLHDVETLEPLTAPEQLSLNVLGLHPGAHDGLLATLRAA